MARIEEIIESFIDLPRDFRLELLLDYADNLPPLPERYRNLEEQQSHLVHECQTPVFLWVDLEAGKVAVYADAPEESPTVRGFLSMMIEAFHGVSPEEVLKAPMDVLDRSWMAETIGMRRLFGLNAIYRRIKQEVFERVAESQV